MSLFSNSSGQDTILNAINLLSTGAGEIFLASPFFSYDSLIMELLEREILVRMIVRLGPLTLPDALKNLIHKEKIQIRYFTSPKFHSKLYIFGDKAALVGSANLTQAGLTSNREISIAISADDERFDRLVSLFNSYWNQSEVLTDERLKNYSRIYRACNPGSGNYEFERQIIENFGESFPAGGIQVGGRRASQEEVFLESYRRTYQEFLTAFRFLERLYQEDGRRKQPEDLVPIRIEIDQFFSYIRDFFVAGDSYKTAPIRHGNDLETFIKEKLNKWFGQSWPYLDEEIPINIQRILNRFSTKSAIENSTIDEIYDALLVCHSFSGRYRFYQGGIDTMEREFKRDNDLKQIKKVIIYLLHGKGEFIDRMGTCIFDENYKIYHTGRSIIQELFGWVNKENIPICNGRTVKALRYLGFNVVVFT